MDKNRSMSTTEADHNKILWPTGHKVLNWINPQPRMPVITSMNNFPLLRRPNNPRNPKLNPLDSMNAKNPPNHRGVRTVTEVSATLVEQMIFRVQPPVAVRLTPQGVRISVEKMWKMRVGAPWLERSMKVGWKVWKPSWWKVDFFEKNTGPSLFPDP